MLIGDRFGKLTVLEFLPERRTLCRCDCGADTIVWRGNLPRGSTTSCGCVRRAMYAAGGPSLRHGHARRFHGEKSSEYRSWTMMINRCVNPNATQYRYYGGRGVSVCDRWRDSFEAFLADMGVKPTPQHSIDRINPHGDYEPDNCRWATRLEQRHNRRDSKQWAAAAGC